MIAAAGAGPVDDVVDISCGYYCWAAVMHLWPPPMLLP